ncbi:hypothetical protein K402DRAFT_98764 [Aulographum hederae CBS 113979]|uniref:Uncharacterized protein n=1 Tax=Aulographum hederae CBS 113979 TaxID=1176131 RepID=A0A6G1GZ82_9PEZI|nr:hypothetical protein K402DRAFT_98764 [Aulographum hederae CBS 113979]
MISVAISRVTRLTSQSSLGIFLINRVSRTANLSQSSADIQSTLVNPIQFPRLASENLQNLDNLVKSCRRLVT